MSEAIGTQGIALKVGDGGDPTELFTTIAEVTGFDGPSVEAAEIEVTSLQSTAKEFIAGLKDNGEISINLNFVPRNAQHKQLIADITSGEKRNYQIDWNDLTGAETSSTLWTFEAFVKGLPVSASPDAALTGTATLRVTGDVTVTDAA